MSDPLQLTPGALESLLADRDADAVAAFVADLYEQTGRNGRREGRVVTVPGRNGDGERLLVWTDDRGRIERLFGGDPPAPDVDAVDAVVITRREAGEARAIVTDLDADLLDVDDLHDRLLYAMDRDSCRDLCREHFDRPVDPKPAPGDGSGGIGVGSLSRPRLALAAVVVCGLLVAGAAGLPDGGAPDGIPLVPGNGTATPGTPESGLLTPVGGSGGSPTPTPTPPSPTPTPTPSSPTPTPTPPPTVPPTITNATAIDLEDGDGVVSDGDRVEVTAAVTDDGSGVERADAFPDSFGVAGPLPMTDADGDGVYDTTFRVEADRASPDGSYTIGLGAIDETGNVNLGRVVTNELELDTSPEDQGEDGTPPTTTSAVAVSRVGGDSLTMPFTGPVVTESGNDGRVPTVSV
jgi:hypothetical protein